MVSTTVVMTQLITQPMLPAICRGHTWRGFDARGAPGTTPGYGAPSAAPQGRRTTAAAEFRARSAGCEAAAGLERRHTACLLGGFAQKVGF
jgi:hypothetical protein